MSKHTSGPWRVTEFDLKYYDLPVIVAGSPDEQVMVAEVVSESPTSNADARLIAAAPDLLEALEYLLTNYGALRYNESGKSQPDEAEIEARAAIAKATGEQP